jgi:glutathione S-transferase
MNAPGSSEKGLRRWGGKAIITVPFPEVAVMSELVLVIGNKRYSSWSLRPWLALKMAGLAFEEVLVPLRQPDTKQRILQYSPSGKVPFLKHGAVQVWDSLAICEYVAELAPQGRLWPDDAAGRAQARAAAAEMHSGFVELRKTMAMDVCVHTPMAEVPEPVQSEISRITALWNDCRSRFGAGGPFLFGRFSIADAMYAPVVTRFTTYGVKLDPVSQAYVEAVWALPAMQEWKAAADQEPAVG